MNTDDSHKHILRKEAKFPPWPPPNDRETEKEQTRERRHDSIYINMCILELTKLIISGITNQDEQVINLSYMVETVSGRHHEEASRVEVIFYFSTTVTVTQICSLCDDSKFMIYPFLFSFF